MLQRDVDMNLTLLTMKLMGLLEIIVLYVFYIFNQQKLVHSEPYATENSKVSYWTGV